MRNARYIKLVSPLFPWHRLRALGAVLIFQGAGARDLDAKCRWVKTTGEFGFDGGFKLPGTSAVY
jgi:hypothetical protein